MGISSAEIQKITAVWSIQTTTLKKATVNSKGNPLYRKIKHRKGLKPKELSDKQVIISSNPHTQLLII